MFIIALAFILIVILYSFSQYFNTGYLAGSDSSIVELLMPKSTYLPDIKIRAFSKMFEKKQLNQMVEEIKKQYPKEAEPYKTLTYKKFMKMSGAELFNNYRFLMNKLILSYNTTGRSIRSEFKTKTKPLTTASPKGVELIDLKLDHDKIKEHLDDLFERADEYNFQILSTAPGIDNLAIAPIGQYLKGEYTRYQQDFHEFLEGLKDVDEYLYDVCTNIYEQILGDNRKKVPFYIARHTSNKGIRMHIDGLGLKSKNIFSVNIGADIYYDMAPIFVKNAKPVRISVPNGTTVNMSGDGRMRWTHCIPDNIPNFKGRYALIFKFN